MNKMHVVEDVGSELEKIIGRYIAPKTYKNM